MRENSRTQRSDINSQYNHKEINIRDVYTELINTTDGQFSFWLTELDNAFPEVIDKKATRRSDYAITIWYILTALYQRKQRTPDSYFEKDEFFTYFDNYAKETIRKYCNKLSNEGAITFTRSYGKTFVQLNEKSDQVIELTLERWMKDFGEIYEKYRKLVG